MSIVHNVLLQMGLRSQAYRYHIDTQCALFSQMSIWSPYSRWTL